MILDYLQESLTQESQEIKKVVRWKAPNTHKTKTIQKFSAGDTIVFDRFSGEPFNKKKGYVARYHQCRRKGEQKKLYVYNPKIEKFDDKQCKLEPVSTNTNESYSYCIEHNMATAETVAGAMCGAGYTYQETRNTQDNHTTLSELREGFKNELDRLYRGERIQCVCNGDLELFVECRLDYGATLEELNEKQRIVSDTINGINQLITSQ